MGYMLKVARVITSCVAGQEEISILGLQGEKRGLQMRALTAECRINFILATEVDLIIQANSLLCVRLPPSFEGKLFTLSSLC